MHSVIGVGRGKTALDVEKLVQWAYRDELSKRVTSSAEGIWDQIEEYGQRGGIDPGHGAAQRYPHFGLPDPDALRIEAAVSSLVDVIWDWEASAAAILGDLAQIAPKRDLLLLRPFKTAALVTMHAKMGTRPDWHPESPRPVPVLSRDEKRPALVGECRGKGAYSTGSYCPLRWEPSPLSIALLRLDYAAWHRGLCTLAETVILDTHEALSPAASAQPWNGDVEPPRTIRCIGEKSIAAKLLLRPQRKRAGPREQVRRAGPMRRISIDRGAKACLRRQAIKRFGTVAGS